MPWAEYRQDERVILLYSVPPEPWRFRRCGELYRTYFDLCGAEVDEADDEVRVAWPDRESIAAFYELFVLPEELAHHFMYWQRRRKALPETLKSEKRRAARVNDAIRVAMFAARGIEVPSIFGNEILDSEVGRSSGSEKAS